MAKELIGLVIDDYERKRIYELVKKYGLKTINEGKFILEKNNYLFAFNEFGFGLVGTKVMNTISKILHGAEEFESFLISNK